MACLRDLAPQKLVLAKSAQSEPEDICLMLFQKYGSPNGAWLRGRRNDNWGTFILLALTEHFLAETKKPRYAEAMGLFIATRQKSQKHTRKLRQRALRRIISFKEKNPNWQHGVDLLKLEFYEHTQLKPHGYCLVPLKAN